MAESVDALVSNTSGAIRAGSTPALGTKREDRETRKRRPALFLFTPCKAKCHPAGGSKLA